MIVMQVKEFNVNATSRWQKAVDRYSNRECDYFPLFGFYVFQTKKKELRQRGYVATGIDEGKDKHCFGMNREKAIKKYKGVKKDVM